MEVESKKLGYCLTCDYDLRMSVHDRCPECGRSFDPADNRSFAARPRSQFEWVAKWLSWLALFICLVGLMMRMWGARMPPHGDFQLAARSRDTWALGIIV